MNRRLVLRRRRKRCRRLLFLLAAAVCVFCIVRLCTYEKHSEETQRLDEELSELYEESDLSEPVVSAVTQYGYQYIAEAVAEPLRTLYEENSDLVGWLKIEDVLSLPVVQGDNNYYLNHDFHGNESDYGTLFLNAAHPFAEETQVLVVHGHSMYDGTMFARIAHYRKNSYAAEHPYLRFTTLYSEDDYEIIGALFLDDAQVASLLCVPSFRTEAAFTAYIESLRENALYFTQEEIPTDTALMILVTCYNDGKLAAVFKRTDSVPLI